MTLSLTSFGIKRCVGFGMCLFSAVHSAETGHESISHRRLGSRPTQLDALPRDAVVQANAAEERTSLLEARLRDTGIPYAQMRHGPSSDFKIPAQPSAAALHSTGVHTSTAPLKPSYQHFLAELSNHAGGPAALVGEPRSLSTPQQPSVVLPGHARSAECNGAVVQQAPVSNVEASDWRTVKSGSQEAVVLPSAAPADLSDAKHKQRRASPRLDRHADNAHLRAQPTIAKHGWPAAPAPRFPASSHWRHPDSDTARPSSAWAVADEGSSALERMQRLHERLKASERDVCQRVGRLLAAKPQAAKAGA